jgi:Fe-Mn family superoxide dismutase
VYRNEPPSALCGRNRAPAALSAPRIRSGGFNVTDTTRREFVQFTGLALLATSAGGSATAAPAPAAPAAPAFENSRTPVPLPFDPRSLKGLSERLLQSHWENNYGGAVKALNTLRGRLAQALAETNAPPFIYNGLKREQLIRTGSVVLHEYYFANLGGDGRAPAPVRSRLAQAFGSFDAWESEFRRIGVGLGGGSGWVMLGHNRQLNLLENHWMPDHATAPADTTPLLVMDMYEHAYQMDYGAAAAKYVDAFFANVQWDIVAARLEASARERAS